MVVSLASPSENVSIFSSNTNRTQERDGSGLSFVFVIHRCQLLAFRFHAIFRKESSHDVCLQKAVALLRNTSEDAIVVRQDFDNGLFRRIEELVDTEVDTESDDPNQSVEYFVGLLRKQRVSRTLEKNRFHVAKRSAQFAGRARGRRGITLAEN